MTRQSDGQIEFIIKTGIDRTESKDAENALRSSEAKFAGLIAIASDAIVSIDGDGRIVIFNHGAEEIFGWSAAEVIGARDGAATSGRAAPPAAGTIQRPTPLPVPRVL